MNSQRSIAKSDLKARWTVLPPLKLKGVGTSLVESVPSYVARMLWTTGVPLNHLVRCVARRAIPGSGSSTTFMVSEALNTIAISRVEELESLSGEKDLRCGSLWALSEIMSYKTNVYGEYKRRWCPQCYEDWDSNSYEPLVWRVDLLGVCPRHQCRMECTCPKCGKFQRDTYQLDLRRTCWACGTSLSTGAIWPKRPDFAHWVDEQIMQLIEFCATPRAVPAPLSIYTDFAMGLCINAKRSGRRDTVMRLILKDIERHARRNSRRPTLRSLLNVCALQGISVQELLCAPRQVSGPLLFDQWPGMSYLPLPSAVHAQRIHAASRYLEDFLALDPPFLPPMNILLLCFHIQLLALKDVAADIFHAYEERYLSQGSRSRLACLRSSFLCARRVLIHPCRRGFPNLNRQAERLARLMEVSLQDATMVLEGAKLMRETQTEEMIEKYRSGLPLRSALDWFLERRRFL
ncbi:hypothetical protein HDE77_001023 [Rhodanobacter sp. MP7CTX1]|nr:hypothetical protein [Rhodanobacter sp. MP7CTX1]